MTQAVQVAQYGSNNVGLSFKNRIINGDMRIDQRNAGASSSNPSGYFLDRWTFAVSQSSKISAQQNQGSVTPPTGFSNYLGITSSSAYSVLSGDYFFVSQFIEGFNTADLNWGTANAQTVTLSFWVRSSLTGTFGGSLQNSAQNRAYPFTYTISTANTWEQKTITVAGDTTGTWIGATNGIGIRLNFGLGVGSNWSGTAGAWNANASANWSTTGATSIVGTSGATFYITGVQLEKGSVATSFDYRPYGTELQLCQRYYAKLKNDGSGTAVALCFGRQQTTTYSTLLLTYPVTMRSEPTFNYSSLGVSDLANYSTAITSIASSYPGYNTALIQVSHAAVGAQNISNFLNILDNTSGYLDMTAEL